MKLRSFIYAVLLAAFCAAPALAADKVSTLVGSASYEDLDKAKSGTASFDLTFPLGHYLALGPVVDYTYIKAEDAEGVESKASVLSFGARAALYVQESHNGFGFSLEALIPEVDAEGFLLSPGVFLEAAAGSKGLFRVEYQHPFHSDHGEHIDLEGWRVSAGWGRRF